MWDKIIGFSAYNAFYFELVLAYTPFVSSLKPQKFFALRITLCLSIFLVISNFLPMFIIVSNYMHWLNLAYAMARFIFLFGLSLFSLRVCFEGKGSKIAFCSIAAYCTQHIFNRVNSIPMYYYWHLWKLPQWAEILSYWTIMTAVYVSCYFAFVKKIKIEPEFDANTKRLLITSFVLVFATVIVSYLAFVYVFYTPAFVNTPLLPVSSLLSAMVCLLALITLFDNVYNKRMERESQMILSLWQRDRKQYKISKQNIELMNIKYHDLKYQLNTIVKDQSSLDELAECLKIYRSMFKTGNETLDVVLTEKSQQCEQYGVQIVTIIDGEILGFMNAVDIYSLFGNAIDNATESLRKVEDITKRIINITIKAHGRMAKIQIENYIKNPLPLINGLPQTTKSDKNIHGFGLKSIRYITSKYDGKMSINVNNNIFSLMILLPIKAESQTA